MDTSKVKFKERKLLMNNLSMLKDFNDIVEYECPKTYEEKVEYFTRIPNDLIKSSLVNKYHISNIFYPIYIELDRNKTVDRRSYVSVGKIFKMCGYKLNTNKQNIFYEAVKCLVFLEKNHMIEFLDDDFDVNSITYQMAIHVRLSRNYCSGNLWTMLSWDDYEKILKVNKCLNTECLIAVYLYVSSYMIYRRNDMPDEEYKNSPSAFFSKLERISEDLGMSLSFVRDCMNFLSSDSNFPDGKSIFIKEKVGSIDSPITNRPKNIPCVYVRNRPGYEFELQLVLEYLEKNYKNFTINPQRGGRKQKKGMSEEEILEYIQFFGMPDGEDECFDVFNSVCQKNGE